MSKPSSPKNKPSWPCQLRELTAKPFIADLRERAETIRQRELERTLRHLGEVDPQVLEHFQYLSRSLVNKLLHEPTIRVKEQAGNGRSAEYVATARHLFGLEKDKTEQKSVLSLSNKL